MGKTRELYYEISSKGRLETITGAIVDGLQNGQDAEVLDDWFVEAKAESARLAGQNALAEGRETVVVDGLEVPSAYSALVRQIENVTAEHIADIAQLFSSERDFTDAMDAMMAGEAVDPRLTQLSNQWTEILPRHDLPGLAEGSILEIQF